MTPVPPGASDIRRLFLHFGLFTLAVTISGVFSSAFLLRQGLTPAMVFLAMGAVLAVRFVFRTLVLYVGPRLGGRRTLMIGAAISAFQYPLLAGVSGLDGMLVAFVAVSGLGEAFYWTAFHACFAQAGEDARLGRQTSVRQIISIGGGIVGPPLGGLLLMHWPPAAFGLSTILRLLSVAPLAGLPELPIARLPPPDAWRRARFGATVFATDGWTIMSASIGWAMIAFLALGSRYDVLGVAMAAAALVGAGATWLLGRHIDMGHGRRAVLINLVASLAILLAQALSAYDPARVVAAMLAGAVLGGFATPAIMAAVYAEAKAASCVFRFQFAAEGGWDIGGIAACLACAAILTLGAPLHATILLAVPALFVQARLVAASYGRRLRAA